MSDYTRFTGKTIEDAVEDARISFGLTSDQMDQLEYVVIEKGSHGFLFGIGAKDAVIDARRKENERPKERQKKKEPREKVKSENKEDAPKSEAPKKEVPKKESPKKEAPKKDAPKKDVPKKEAPKKDAPKKDAPKKEAPKKEVPKKETPKKEEPAKKPAAKIEAQDDAGGFRESTVNVKVIDQKEKPALVPLNEEEKAKIMEESKVFVKELLSKMGIESEITVTYDDNEQAVEMDVAGPDMGSLIGKRGQTLYAVQYITSLYINKNTKNYIRFKIDTENYKERRKEILEKLAANMANKVRRTHRKVEIEPMNPYERRIIHAALQNNKYVETYSEGVDPYRKIIIAPKR